MAGASYERASFTATSPGGTGPDRPEDLACNRARSDAPNTRRFSQVLCVISDVVQIALGDDPKSADRRQRAALGAIDLVHTVALPDRPAIASTWEVEILREYVTRVPKQS